MGMHLVYIHRCHSVTNKSLSVVLVELKRIHIKIAQGINFINFFINTVAVIIICSFARPDCTKFYFNLSNFHLFNGGK